MQHQLPDLPYSHDALEPFIDARTMQIHHGKHHAGYVSKLNDALGQIGSVGERPLEELLHDISVVPEEHRQSVRNNGGGHHNHSLFWQILTPDGGSSPQGELSEALRSTFGSFEQFQQRFTAAALGRFGSGWAWVAVNGHGGLEITSTPNQDSPLMLGLRPILGLDVWEHAYYLQYQNRRADYVRAWWNVVNWSRVGELYHQALSSVHSGSSDSSSSSSG